MGKLTNFTAPAGTAKYTHLVKPNTKFNADGKFEVTMVYSLDDPNWLTFDELIKKTLEESREEAIKEIDKGKNPGAIAKKKAELSASLPYSEEYDENGQPTGNITIKFSGFAKNKDGSERVVKMFDTKPNEITGKVNPSSGSILKVAGYMQPYYNPSTNAYGLSMKLSAVQVLKLVEYNGGSAFGADTGFEYQPGNNEIQDGASDGSIPF